MSYIKECIYPALGFLEGSIVVRFFVLIFSLSIVFLSIFTFMGIFVLNDYRSYIKERITTDRKKERKPYIYYKDLFTEKANIIHSQEIIEENLNSEYETELYDSVGVLNTKAFYQNLNNSRQYLRRDSFS